MKIKAAVLEELGKPLAIYDDIEVPLLKSGQVIVKIAYSGICRSQLMEIQGGRGQDKYLPHMLGHEASGTVVEVGNEVSKVKVGDKVILGWIKGTGMDAGGTQYHKGQQVINAGAVTTFSDYAVVSENRCYLHPHNIPMHLSPLLGCAILTGMGLVLHDVNPEKNATFAIIGLGGVGLSALLAIRLLSPRLIIAVDTDERKLALATALGAQISLYSGNNDIVKDIREFSGGGVDYAIEAAGHSSTIEKAFQSVRPNGGLCVFASHPDEREYISLRPFDFHLGRRIRGTWGGGCLPDQDIPAFADLYAKGNLPIEKLICDTFYKLENINDAIDRFHNSKEFRIILRINSETK